jgi:hypothetical protein
MIYLLKVYALVTFSVFSAMGVVYLGFATIWMLMPALQRLRAPALHTPGLRNGFGRAAG